jgi:hypothetical protein
MGTTRGCGPQFGCRSLPLARPLDAPEAPTILVCEAEAEGAGSWPVGELVRVIVEAPWPGQLRFRRSWTSSTRCARWGLSTQFDRFLPVGLGLGSWENQGFQFRVRQSGLTAMNNRRGVTGHLSDDGKPEPRTLDHTPPNRRTTLLDRLRTKLIATVERTPWLGNTCWNCPT